MPAATAGSVPEATHALATHAAWRIRSRRRRSSGFGSTGGKLHEPRSPSNRLDRRQCCQPPRFAAVARLPSPPRVVEHADFRSGRRSRARGTLTSLQGHPTRSLGPLPLRERVDRNSAKCRASRDRGATPAGHFGMPSSVASLPAVAGAGAARREAVSACSDVFACPCVAHHADHSGDARSIDVTVARGSSGSTTALAGGIDAEAVGATGGSSSVMNWPLVCDEGARPGSTAR